MNGAGRPRPDVDHRRRQLLHYVVASAAASGDAVKRLADRFKLPERTIRNDLEALRTELATASADELPASLVEAIGGADSYRKLQELTNRIMVELANGNLDRDLAQTLIEAITSQRHMIRADHDEKPLDAVRALELLTPQEETLLADYRKKLAGPPVEPGVAVLPPGSSPTSPAEGGTA